MKKVDYENFLQQKFGEQNPHVLDDEWPDAFDEWLCALDVQEFIDYADEWGKTL